MTSRDIFLHLSLIDTIGPVVVRHLVQKLSLEGLSALYRLTLQDFVHTFGLSELCATKLYNGLRDQALLEKEQSLIEKHGVQLISLYDDEYPSLLKEIYAPPTVLYVQGSVQVLSSNGLAIVGSRMANLYGKKVITRLVPELVQHKLAIVSGGALGADTMAHEVTVNAGGITIVVLGSGLLELYPKSNLNLFKRVIASGGALVSSFPLTMQALPGNFPARNRVISGLSRGCLVVQAAKKSGAIITATYALDQGRDVFAIPGPIDDDLSIGCHQLIQQGATLVQSVDDILQEYGMVKSVKTTLIKSEKENSVVSSAQPKTVEEKIQYLCTAARSIDELLQETETDLSQLQTILFYMQLDGVISQNFAGLWQTNSLR